VLLGYSSMHKYFKCLVDVSTDRIYISRDVVFDENIFSFAKLHPNAGARLRYKILLLPPSLIALELLHNGVNKLDEPVANFPNSTNKKSRIVGGVQIANLDDKYWRGFCLRSGLCDGSYARKLQCSSTGAD
jgi:hypothetical protein